MFFTILTLIYFTMYVSHCWTFPTILRAPPVGLLMRSDKLCVMLQGVVRPLDSPPFSLQLSMLPMWCCMHASARYALMRLLGVQAAVAITPNLIGAAVISGAFYG